MKALLSILVVVVVALASLLYVVMKGSRAVELQALRARVGLQVKRIDALSKENLSLSEQKAFMKTELQKAGTGLQEVKDRLEELTRANDHLRRECARLRVDLDHEKRRCDTYYQRLMEVLAQQGMLGSDDNITA